MNLRCAECGEPPRPGDDVVAECDTDGTRTGIICLQCHAANMGVTLSTLKAFVAACVPRQETMH